MNHSLNMKKLLISIIIIIIFMVCFVSTTFALIYNKVTVEDNYYQTGVVKVSISELQKIDKEDINDSLPINSDSNDIELKDFLFEPGMTVVKAFTVKNESSCDVYYRLYLDELEGDLADVIEITITIDDDDNDSSNDTILFSNVIASNLSKDSINDDDFIKDNPNSVDELEEGESKSYKIYFHYPSDSNNSGQDKSLSFKLSVEATQTKNNTDREFNN